ncbi:hypothetical protein [Streptomyces sp. NPDC047070]|uniref:hypothetical protein n=1 Tax=Streptomyces sp. NPDC047070 TaxID=3154923 RepID=UPI0034552C71
MNFHDGAEPFGPEYVRPANADCPDCPCCTNALCVKGRASLWRCAGHVGDESLKQTVAGCPCSAETTRGTLAWRALRVRAVTLATEKPLPAPLEVKLSAIAHGQFLTVSPDVTHLIARGLVVSGGTELTEYGRQYLWARTEVRTPTMIRVVDVDASSRTARVFLSGRAVHRPVTVPMDQLANGHTGLTSAQLPGAALHAYANCQAVHCDDVVLTRVTNPLLPQSLTVAPVDDERAGE